MTPAPRRIFDTSPATWQELEVMVAQAFSEMGYECNRGHELTTVRGRVRVDVHAVKRTTPIPTVVLCECKYWDTAVPQSVVYAFRSINADVGAHFGLIISKAGFQSGAVETREATNIHLLDFGAFQATFFDEWRRGIFEKFAQMTAVLNPLLKQLFFPESAEFQLSTQGFQFMRKYAMFFGTDECYSSFFINSAIFPATIPDPRGDPRSSEVVTIQSLRQYYEIGQQAIADARQHFGV